MFPEQGVCSALSQLKLMTLMTCEGEFRLREGECFFLPSPLDNRYTDVVSLHYRNQLIVDRREMLESRPEGKKPSLINYHSSFN